jgi:hypothetical protein
MMPPIVFSSAGAGNTNTLSANGLMFIVSLYFMFVTILIVSAAGATQSYFIQICAKITDRVISDKMADLCSLPFG